MTGAIANPMADRLRALIARGNLIKMPCCFDALSAKLVEQAGFDLTFLSGFGASASRLEPFSFIRNHLMPRNSSSSQPGSQRCAQ